MLGTALSRSVPAALGALGAGVVAAVALGADGGLGIAAAGAAGALAGGALGWRFGSGGRATGAPRQPRSPPAAAEAGLPGGYGRYLIDALPLGVIVVEAGGRVAFVNPRARQLFGLPPRQPIHVSALRAPRLLEAVVAAARERTPGQAAFTLVRQGEAHLRASIQPLGSAEDDPVLVMIEDESQERRARELHRDFVANASHELKTPLASISGIIETLQGAARDDPAATERFLRLMAEQAERMKALVRDLLSLNRIEINERIPPEQPQPIRRLVWEAAQSLQQTAADAGMTIEADPPAEAPLVAGDAEELVQLFANLIDNAIKYGRPGTAVTIRAIEDAPDRPGRIGIAVIDRGQGVAREHIPRLTERFYRVSVDRSRAKGGTGLGLAIVKHIVSRHRGELGIESTPGDGSTFTVWLPLLPAEPRSDGSEGIVPHA